MQGIEELNDPRLFILPICIMLGFGGEWTEVSIHVQELKEKVTREYGNINGDWLKTIGCFFQNSVMVGEVYDNISATVGDVLEKKVNGF